MTEHVWRFGEDEFSRLIFVCGEPDCDVVLKPEEAIARLNEYETLKAATERLSAEDAKRAANRIDLCGYSDLDVMARLRAYANILEGNDDYT